jgi:hypothetical protein
VFREERTGKAHFAYSTAACTEPAGISVEATNRRKIIHTVNLYCFTPLLLLDHLTQSSYPEDLREALRPFDNAVLTTAKLALGVDLAGLIALRRARLPPSRSGLLLRQRGGHGDGFIPDAAFWGAVAQAVPTFADRPNTPGFLPELTDVVGAGSFEQGGGRYTHLLARQGAA